MDKVTLGTIGKIFTNNKNSQTKIDLRKKKLKEFGLEPEDVMNLDITEQIKKIKCSKINNFENNFESKW